MNSPHLLYHKWLEQLSLQWADEHKARLKLLSWFLAGLFLSSHVHVKKAARKIPGSAQQTSKERKLLGLLHNKNLQVRNLYKPIAGQLAFSHCSQW